MSGAGYREISACLRGEVSLEEAMEQIRRSTRQYARRQLTWFRNQLPESAVRIDATVPIEVQVEAALGAWHDAGADTVSDSRHIDGGRT